MEKRTFHHDIMQEIKDRWSPRAFADSPVSKEEIEALLEAASYAPSCFNEQPWRFIVADGEPAISKMRGILSDSNRIWAGGAPVLILIVSMNTFSHNGKPNAWHTFDAGTAWGYLSLEAQRRGLITHAMAGFSKDGARKEFSIAEDIDIIALVAVGRYGDKSSLPQDLQEREYPQTREEIRDLLLNEKE